MANTRNDYDSKAYNPTFKREFLAPKHWGTWLGLTFGLPLTLLPNSVRVSIARFIARKMCKKQRGSVQKARINLALCFPEKSEQEREAILEKCLVTAGTFLLGFPAISLRSKKWLERNSSIIGLEYLQDLQKNNQSAILLVPHSWCIDIPAILLASRGLPVSAMANSQKNPFTDWLMHKQRVQYGGRVYDRSGGIKPFIKSVKDGYLGYYLPDQDHGPEQSVFVDFFATEKATLPGLGKLAKVSRAKIVPTFASYNIETGKYEIEIKPPLEDLSGDEYIDARVMNEVVEGFVNPRPEQYMWILKLLKTRRDGNDPYVGY
ncbi:MULTISPECIES: lauroyl-Kdo(2)-lipid IV(A) myristoyltransferase [Vibrio]|uniref:lauroyl-Kdo(2)-lipid IV(A) myristoyltransferase n=1 Tax=Vibrio TaxID=662 RepID=UPI00084CCBB3|nr:MULTISPECIES: lauroyl-Kdo(2)-lipid IV(A) myristoyltransferase [Vibrio]OEF01131.1 lipid A biosynthesis (KDO)2-(lauroyl)-lipid IVA acyltransferase [Vibrio genomosp. F10 str. 9ZD137]WGW00499.1 lauroyl-Kdo(2)-lipid IV(A) myristoyltransferase [Vibrio sp. YMD68]